MPFGYFLTDFLEISRRNANSAKFMPNTAIVAGGFHLGRLQKFRIFVPPLSANSRNLPYSGCLPCLLLKVPPALSADVIYGSPLSEMMPGPVLSEPLVQGTPD